MDISPIKNSKRVFLLVTIVIVLIGAYILFFRLKKEQHVPLKPLAEHRIGIITDVQTNRKKSFQEGFDSTLIVSPLQRFVEHANNEFKPEVVVSIGDFIEGTGRFGEKSIEDFKALDAYLQPLTMPHLQTIGNHERRGFTDDTWKTLTGNSSTYYAYDIDDLRIIVLDYDDVGVERQFEESEDGAPEEDSTIDNEADDRRMYAMTETELQWIEKTLQESADRRIVVFMHVPINQELIDRGYHDKVQPLEQRVRLKDLFARYGVKAVISGHVEVPFYSEDRGVRYFTLPGFHKSAQGPIPDVSWLGTYSDATLSENFSLRMYYKRTVDGEYQSVSIPSAEFEALKK